MKNFVLIYPPVAQPFSPSLAIAELSSVIQVFGGKAIPIDLNIRTHKELLTKKYIYTKNLEFEKRLKRLERKNSFSPEEIIEYHYLIEKVLKSPILFKNIDQALNSIRDIKNYDLNSNCEERLKNAWIIFHNAREFVFGTIDKTIYDEAYTSMNSDSIIFHINNRKANPYHKLYRKHIKKIISKQPDYIFINVTFPEQLIPAFILASKLKIIGTAKTLIGGSLISLLKNELKLIPELFNYVDALCVGEGEPVVKHLVNNNEFQSIPNCLFGNKNKKVIETAIESWDVTQSPTPVFNRDDLKRLFTPLPIIPYQTLKSCYYGKCKFCNYTSVNDCLKEKTTDQIISDLLILSSKYKTNLFSLADDATPAAKLLEISKGLLSRNIKDLLWWTCTRFDGDWNKELLRVLEKSGCARLFFGLESAVSRVQQKIAGKGFTLKKVNKVIDLLKETKIHPHISAVIGFPTETLEESQMTVKYMKDMALRPKITTRIHKFRLMKDSPIYDSIINQTNIFMIKKAIKSDRNNLAIQFVDFESSDTVETEKVNLLLDEFVRYKRDKPQNNYGEYHTFEPLIWAKYLNRNLSQKQWSTHKEGEFYKKICKVSALFNYRLTCHSLRKLSNKYSKLKKNYSLRSLNKGENLILLNPEKRFYLYELTEDNLIELSLELNSFIKFIGSKKNQSIRKDELQLRNISAHKIDELIELLFENKILTN